MELKLSEAEEQLLTSAAIKAKQNLHDYIITAATFMANKDLGTNNILKYIEERMTVMPNDYVSKKDAMIGYLGYCIKRGIMPSTFTQFSKILKKAYIVSNFRSTFRDGQNNISRVMCWRGLGWKAFDDEKYYRLIDEERKLGKIEYEAKYEKKV